MNNYDLLSYNDFLNRVDRWYTTNEHKYMKYMATFGKIMISQSEFVWTLITMKSPFNKKELIKIYRLIDENKEGSADYTKLHENIWNALNKKFEKEDLKRSQNLERHDRYILATFRIPSLEITQNAVTSFTHLIDLGYTGNMLRQLIRSKLKILTTKFIIVFTDPTHYSKSIIKNSQTLEEFNIKGGSKAAPEETTIYYEFSSGSINCPLLNNSCRISKSITGHNEE